MAGGGFLPRTLMVPSFIMWKSTSKSMVSRRKAVNVISFSGSSWKGCMGCQQCQKRCDADMSAYLASQQKFDLVLHALGLSEQAFLDVQPLKPAFASSHIVDFCGAVLLCAT